MSLNAHVGADVFDGERRHTNATLLLRAGAVEAILAATLPPPAARIVRHDGGTILPGFVDLQANGGGGVMFNAAPDVATLSTMAAAHRATGTRALLATLITDSPAVTRAAIEAVADAVAEGVGGIAGLHLEGPHLAVARKGAHDPALIRPMTDADLSLLCEAAARLPALMVTLAPETVPPTQIEVLAKAGVTVFLGHSDCTHDEARRAIDAGARGVTHLFNAMSQMTARAPGLVGTALSDHRLAAGLIADAVHVDPATIRAALGARSAGVFLVTDAMATLGSDCDSFTLNGREIRRSDGRLTLADGTLAGADLTLARAISVLVERCGIDRDRALAMATSEPGGLLGGTAGRLLTGAPADAIHLGRGGVVTAIA